MGFMSRKKEEETTEKKSSPLMSPELEKALAALRQSPPSTSTGTPDTLSTLLGGGTAGGAGAGAGGTGAMAAAGPMAMLPMLLKANEGNPTRMGGLGGMADFASNIGRKMQGLPIRRRGGGADGLASLLPMLMQKKPAVGLAAPEMAPNASRPPPDDVLDKWGDDWERKVVENSRVRMPETEIVLDAPPRVQMPPTEIVLGNPGSVKSRSPSMPTRPPTPTLSNVLEPQDDQQNVYGYSRRRPMM